MASIGRGGKVRYHKRDLELLKEVDRLGRMAAEWDESFHEDGREEMKAVVSTLRKLRKHVQISLLPLQTQPPKPARKESATEE